MLSLKNLLRRKVRSLLTIIGVAVGVAAVVALISVTRGLRNQMDGLFSSGQAHLVITQKGAADPLISHMPESLLEPLRASEGIATADPFLFGMAQLSLENKPSIFLYFGVTSGSPFLENVTLVEGRGLFDTENPAQSILLGRRAADHLDLHVGSTLRLADRQYTVVGLYESVTPLVDAGGLLPFADAQHEMGLGDQMSSVLIRIADFDADRLAQYEADLEAAFPQIEATAPASFTNTFDEFEVMDEAVIVLSILAVIVGGIGVMNTLLTSVFERTREIGILQAIGWSKMMILRQVLVEACLLCLLGGIVGCGFGVAAVELIGRLGQFGWLASEYSPLLFLQALAVGVGMGLIGASYPAWRALRVSPIEALRYE